jgi:uncharacterized membrane protein required for colicin V production
LTQSIRADQLTIAILVMALAAFIGYRRGILRELIVAPAILLAPLVGPPMGVFLVPWVNRFYKLFLFARFGGLATDDIAKVMDKVKQMAPLVASDQSKMTLVFVCVMVLIAVGYAIAHFAVKGPKDALTHLLGAVLGAINGYNLARIIVPALWSAQYTEIVVPTGSVLQIFQQQTTLVIVLAFIVLVVFGLQLAARK